MMGVTAVRPVETMLERTCDEQWLNAIALGKAACIEAVDISYDLLQATAAQLERRITQLDAPLSDGWGDKLLREFIHYVEKGELDDLEIRDRGLPHYDRHAHRAAYRFAGYAGRLHARMRRNPGGR